MQRTSWRLAATLSLVALAACRPEIIDAPAEAAGAVETAGEVNVTIRFSRAPD